MFDNYEKFKKDVYALTKIDLNYYKEKQMRRRIDTIATKHGCSNYDEYIRCLLYTSPSPRDVEESRMPSSA